VKHSGLKSFENCTGPPLSTLTPSNCVSTGPVPGFEPEDRDRQPDFRSSEVLKPLTVLMGALDKIHFPSDASRRLKS
jgi:hypothetical protein